MKKLNLTDVLLPPSNILEDNLPNKSWETVERNIGSCLPTDYKNFITTYGTGTIDNFLWIFNPFSTNEILNLESQLKSQRRVLLEIQKNGNEVLPYKTYPEENGILPFGLTDNGDTLYWLTSKNADRWTVVANPARDPEWYRYNGNMSEFLIAILTNKEKCTIFPDDFPNKYPIFTPSC